jgi:hypothetical protein
MPLGSVTFYAKADGKHVGLSIIADDLTKIVYVKRIVPPPILEGADTNVRGSVNSPAPGGAWAATDFEVPAGIEIKYEAVVEGDDDTDQATVEVVVDGFVDYGGDYLMPVGYPEAGMNVYIEYGGFGQLTYQVQADPVPVIGRPDPVVVTFGRNMWTGTVNFLTLTDGARRTFLGLMQSAVLMLATRPGFGFEVPLFVAPGTVTEERTVGYGGEDSRRWAVDFTQVARPPAHYDTILPATSWQEHLDDGDTWQIALDSGVIWFDYAGLRLS